MVFSFIAYSSTTTSHLNTIGLKTGDHLLSSVVSARAENGWSASEYSVRDGYDESNISCGLSSAQISNARARFIISKADGRWAGSWAQQASMRFQISSSKPRMRQKSPDGRGGLLPSNATIVMMRQSFLMSWNGKWSEKICHAMRN